jgi:hypothetical protein
MYIKANRGEVDADEEIVKLQEQTNKLADKAVRGGGGLRSVVHRSCVDVGMEEGEGEEERRLLCDEDV